MRKRFRGDDNKCEWNYKFGLIGSPHRDFVIRDMENSISLREQPVTSHFISTLALLEFAKRTPGEPPYPAGGNEEQIRQWQTQIDQIRSIYDGLRLQYLQQLVMVVPQKEGQARATSLQTLLNYRAELSAAGFSQWSTLLAPMPEVFDRLPLDDQLSLLTDQWKPIASAAMLPVLRKVFNYSYNTTKNYELEVLDLFKQIDLRSIALRRIYELSPEEGRRLIVEEIGRPEPRVKADVLRSLPEDRLPELNNVLLTNLKHARRNRNWSTGVIGELIERYATAEILSQVRSVYEAQDVYEWECSAGAALLAYFLRVEPSLGGEYLKKALGAKGRGYAGCYTSTLTSVAKLHMSAKVENVATAALDDDDSQVVSQAAGVLAEYGSADAEKALWRQLEKWHEAAQNRSEKELSYAQEQIEEALREALARGNSWLSDPEKLKRVRDLCLTKSSRDQVDKLINGWDCKIYVGFNSFDEPWSIRVAHYELKSLASLKMKLLQFPKGTVFKFSSDKSSTEEVFQQIKNYLEENGMKLERDPKE